jgi:hypothetical protein
MTVLLSTVPGPWGDTGTEFQVKELDSVQQHYLDTGVLVEVDTTAGMSPKERAVAKAEALGLDTSGTQKEIEARVEGYVPDQPE